MHVEPEYGVLSPSCYHIYPVHGMCSAGGSEDTPSLRSYRPDRMDLVDACHSILGCVMRVTGCYIRGNM